MRILLSLLKFLVLWILLRVLLVGVRRCVDVSSGSRLEVAAAVAAFTQLGSAKIFLHIVCLGPLERAFLPTYTKAYPEGLLPSPEAGLPKAFYSSFPG
jgi:hypothetical protein